MLKSIVSTESMNRDEWLKWRNKGIGGSDAAIVCGMNKYKSPVELWMQKTGRIEPKEAGESAYWGKVMEPIIMAEFAQRTGLEVGTENSILQHPYYPFMLGNVDGIVIDPVHKGCIFEAKTASTHRLDDWEDGVPDEYHLQVQHYMAVTNFSGAYIAVLIGGNQFKWYFIERDEDLIQMLIKLEQRFWNYVVTDTQPPMDGSESASDFISGLYPKATAKSEIILPESAIELIEQFEKASEHEKQATELKEEAGNKLKELLKDNEIGVVGDRKVSWKNVKSERFDSKKLQAEMPDVYSKFIIKSSYRRFTVK